MKHNFGAWLAACLSIVLSACSSMISLKAPVETTSSVPGVRVTLKGETKQLEGTPITLGSPIPETYLIDAFSMRKVDISQMKGKVLFLSLVPSLENTAHMKGKILYTTRMPSLDTKFCEAQTQYLGEEGKDLPKNVVRIAISRDTPYAQRRFAHDANITNIMYLSDYREGAFGRSTGLLVADRKYLARAIILVDKEGVVRYIQVVPELTHLPDMDTAFAVASNLAQETY